MLYICFSVCLHCMYAHFLCAYGLFISIFLPGFQNMAQYNLYFCLRRKKGREQKQTGSNRGQNSQEPLKHTLPVTLGLCLSIRNNTAKAECKMSLCKKPAESSFCIHIKLRWLLSWRENMLQEISPFQSFAHTKAKNAQCNMKADLHRHARVQPTHTQHQLNILHCYIHCCEVDIWKVLLCDTVIWKSCL